MIVPQSVEARWGLCKNERLVFVPIEAHRILTVIKNVALVALGILTLGLLFVFNPLLQDDIYWALFHNKKIVKMEKDPFNLMSLMNFSRFKSTLNKLGWSEKEDSLKHLVTKKRASKLDFDRRVKKILSMFYLAKKQNASIFSRLQPSKICSHIDTSSYKLGPFDVAQSLSIGTKSIMEDIIFSSRFDIHVAGAFEKVTACVLMDGHGIQKGIEPINLYTKKHFFNHLKTYLNVYLKPGISLQGVYEAFKATFHEINENYPSMRSGSTFVGIFFISNVLFCVSIGDSKALLVDPYQSFPMSLAADPLHPHFSKKLLKAQADIISAGESTRVQGLLNMAAALGDKHIMNKAGKRVIKPSMSFIALPLVWLKSPFQIVLGSDGVFDYVHEREITHVVRSDLSLEQKTEELVQKAFFCGSNDNLSATIIKL